MDFFINRDQSDWIDERNSNYGKKLSSGAEILSGVMNNKVGSVGSNFTQAPWTI